MGDINESKTGEAGIASPGNSRTTGSRTTEHLSAIGVLPDQGSPVWPA
jgi:hypothetical protein